jgi:hypothetical protein
MRWKVSFLPLVFVLCFKIFGNPDTPDSAADSISGNTEAGKPEVPDTSKAQSYWDQTGTCFADPWTAEIGGNFGLSTMNYNGITVNSFIMDPLVNVFITHGVFIGPILLFSNNWGGERSEIYREFARRKAGPFLASVIA